jgi:hypothetical protein
LARRGGYSVSYFELSSLLLPPTNRGFLPYESLAVDILTVLTGLESVEISDDQEILVKGL